MTGWIVSENFIFLRRVNYHSEKQKVLQKNQIKGVWTFIPARAGMKKKYTKEPFAKLTEINFLCHIHKSYRPQQKQDKCRHIGQLCITTRVL